MSDQFIPNNLEKSRLISLLLPALQPVQALVHFQPPLAVPVIASLAAQLKQPHLVHVHEHVEDLTLGVLPQIVGHAVVLDVGGDVLHLGTAPQDLQQEHVGVQALDNRLRGGQQGLQLGNGDVSAGAVTAQGLRVILLQQAHVRVYAGHLFAEVDCGILLQVPAVIGVLVTDDVQQFLVVVGGEDDRVELDSGLGLALQVTREVHHVGDHDDTQGLHGHLHPLQDVVDEGLVGEALVNLIKHYQLDGSVGWVFPVRTGQQIREDLLGLLVFLVVELVQDGRVHLLHVEIVEAVHVERMELGIVLPQVVKHLCNEGSLPAAGASVQAQWAALSFSQAFHVLTGLLDLLPAPGHPLVQVLQQRKAWSLAIGPRQDFSLVEAVAVADEVLDVGVGEGGVDFDFDADWEQVPHVLQRLRGQYYIGKIVIAMILYDPGLPCIGLQTFKIEMRITKRPSLSKLAKQPGSHERPMNMTMTSAMFSSKEVSEPKLPPLRPLMRKTSARFPRKAEEKQRQETQTTLMGSEMFQSYYQTVDKGWVKPSEYLREIDQVNLMGEGAIDMGDYEIKLSEKMEKNMARLDSLMVLMEKWISMLKKILQYTTSKKSNTPHLIEQVKFWKALSKKFDQLQYQFNNQKISQLLVLMKNSLKTKPEYKKSFDEFIRLKDTVLETTPMLRKLYLSLEQGVSGSIQRFSENSDIATSTEYLKRILLTFEMIAENNEIVRGRMEVVYDKMNEAMVQKLTVAPLYPRELANISSVREKYSIIDRALSFYSNLIGVMEQSGRDVSEILERAEHTRNVLVHLLQIMGYFEYLYRRKEVLEFSKLFSTKIDYNIYDHMQGQQWAQFMEKVYQSMSSKKYEP